MELRWFTLSFVLVLSSIQSLDTAKSLRYQILDDSMGNSTRQILSNERYKRLIPYMTFYIANQAALSPSHYTYTPVSNVPNKLDNQQLIQNYYQGAQYQLMPHAYLANLRQNYRQLPYIVASQQIEGQNQQYLQNGPSHQTPQIPIYYKLQKPFVNSEHVKETSSLKSHPSSQYIQLYNPYYPHKSSQSPKVFSITHFKTLSRPTASAPQSYTSENSESNVAQSTVQKIPQYIKPIYYSRPQILKTPQQNKYTVKYKQVYPHQREESLSDYASITNIPKPDVDKLTADYYSQSKLNDEKSNQEPTEELLTHYAPNEKQEQKIASQHSDPSIHSLTQILQTLQRANALYQPRLPISMKAIYNYLDKHPDDNTLQNLEAQNNEENDLGVDTLSTDDQENGTPGKAGVDYPALSIVPHTKFSCKTQRYKGFFGDPETNCQVWHYCDLNGGQASFLCPNGTLFSQQALTCDWWFNVRCDSTPQLYVLNERLYKYILPMKPSFPEDYSGPEVDNYIHLKFEEAEAKRKEKKANQTALLKEKAPETPVAQNIHTVVDENVQTKLEDFLTTESGETA